LHSPLLLHCLIFVTFNHLILVSLVLSFFCMRLSSIALSLLTLHPSFTSRSRCSAYRYEARKENITRSRSIKEGEG
jgi:hypothetical protein